MSKNNNNKHIKKEKDETKKDEVKEEDNMACGKKGKKMKKGKK